MPTTPRGSRTTVVQVITGNAPRTRRDRNNRAACRA